MPFCSYIKILQTHHKFHENKEKPNNYSFCASFKTQIHEFKGFPMVCPRVSKLKIQDFQRYPMVCICLRVSKLKYKNLIANTSCRGLRNLYERLPHVNYTIFTKNLMLSSN